MTATFTALTAVSCVLAAWWTADAVVDAQSSRRLAPPTARGWRGPLSRVVDRLRPPPTSTDALAGFLESVAEGLRAGSSLPQSLASARVDDSLTGEVAALRAGIRHGLPIDDALDGWAGSDDDRRLAAAVLALAADLGGPTAQAVDDGARRLRSRADVRRQARAMAAQATASAVVVSLAPLAFLLLSTGSDERTVHFLTRTGPGAVCLTAGLLLDALGFVWMRRLVRAATP